MSDLRSTSGIAFGDNVRVLSTPLTESLKLAGRVGAVYGETTPSVTGVSVVGELTRDYAVNVSFDDEPAGLWFDEALLEFVDHGAGANIRIGDAEFVRSADGAWERVRPKRWLPFWA